MKIFRNDLPLHKLYGFLLLNVSLFVLIPMVLGVAAYGVSTVDIHFMIALFLSLGGAMLSILFILRKKVAIYLLTILLLVTIFVVVVFTCVFLAEFKYTDWHGGLLLICMASFFVLEGILGLLIIHSNKLVGEFDNYH